MLIDTSIDCSNDVALIVVLSLEITGSNFGIFV